MNSEEKKKLLRDHHSQIQQLNRIVRDWYLIPGAPMNEFEQLTNQILSHLQRGVGKDKLERIIQGELVTSYGFDIQSDRALEYAEQIYNWWIDRK